jgi:hypothetical protein
VATTACAPKILKKRIFADMEGVCEKKSAVSDAAPKNLSIQALPNRMLFFWKN